MSAWSTITSCFSRGVGSLWNGSFVSSLHWLKKVLLIKVAQFADTGRYKSVFSVQGRAQASSCWELERKHIIVDWLIGQRFTPYRQYFSPITAVIIGEVHVKQKAAAMLTLFGILPHMIKTNDTKSVKGKKFLIFSK